MGHALTKSESSSDILRSFAISARAEVGAVDANELQRNVERDSGRRNTHSHVKSGNAAQARQKPPISRCPVLRIGGVIRPIPCYDVDVFMFFGDDRHFIDCGLMEVVTYISIDIMLFVTEFFSLSVSDGQDYRVKSTMVKQGIRRSSGWRHLTHVHFINIRGAVRGRRGARRGLIPRVRRSHGSGPSFSRTQAGMLTAPVENLHNICTIAVHMCSARRKCDRER